MKNSFGYVVDLLIFGIENKKNYNFRELPTKHLSILLVKRNHEPFNNAWCIPGGFVNDNEISSNAANRVLKKETNLTKVYLNHLDVFDSIDRDPRGRIISNAYMSLVDKEKITDNLNENSKWFNIDINEKDSTIEIMLTNNKEILNIKLKKIQKYKTTKEYTYEIISSEIAFDHGLIIGEGIEELKNKVENTDIVFNLMPYLFTIGELKQVYELLLNKPLVNSAFRRVIANKIEATDTIIKKGGFRPSTLFKYKNN